MKKAKIHRYKISITQRTFAMVIIEAGDGDLTVLHNRPSQEMVKGI